MAGSRPISIRKKFGSVLTRSPSNISEKSAASLSSPSSSSTTPATTDSEFSPDVSRNVSRVGSPTPPIPVGAPLERQSTTSSSMASSWFSRLTMSSPRSDPFEAYRADKQRRERKQQRAVEKRIKEFHATITGAVFVGTVIHYMPSSEHPALRDFDIREKDVDSGAEQRGSYGRNYKVGVTNISPKEPPPPRSTRAQHYETFISYYNDCDGDPLECFFDVFIKSVPREGARVSFIVTPTGEDDSYVAVACNIVDRFTPMRVDSKCPLLHA